MARFNPIERARAATFVPTLGQFAAVMVATGLLAGFQVLVSREGRVVHAAAACTLNGEPEAGERISVPVRCDTGTGEHRTHTRDSRVVLAFLGDRSVTLRCDVMASGSLSSCR